MSNSEAAIVELVRKQICLEVEYNEIVGKRTALQLELNRARAAYMQTLSTKTLHGTPLNRNLTVAELIALLQDTVKDDPQVATYTVDPTLNMTHDLVIRHSERRVDVTG